MLELSKIDTIIILSHKMTKEGVLNLESKSRADKAIKYFNLGISKSIITLGWDYRKDSNINIATAVKNYLIENQIDPTLIIENHLSRDTVGDAFFGKLEMFNHNLKKALIITSDYHLERSKKIFKKFFNNNLELFFDSCKGFDTKTHIESEEKSLKKFKKTFSKSVYTNREIHQILINNHPYYNGDKYPKISSNEDFISRTL